MDEPHRLLVDELHRADRVRLELEARLLKAGLLVRILARALARGPCLWVVW